MSQFGWMGLDHKRPHFQRKFAEGGNSVKRLLITGGNGLLGSEVTRLSPSSISLNSKTCNLITDSLGQHMKDVDVVIHTAAKVGGIKANMDFVADFYNDNMKMNINVIEACKEKNAKLISILSTCVYPDADYAKYPLTEDQIHMGPPHASNFGYAYAKRMLDVQSRAYRQQHGCNFITVIPNNLYGINDNYDLELGHVIPALIRKFHEAKIKKEKSVTVWGSGRPLREFTFARDVAKIILWLVDNYDGSDPVNIGNTSQISISDLSKMIAEISGFEGEIIFDASKPEGQYQKPSSNSKLKNLGWNEEYTPLREGLTETIFQFQNVYPGVRGVTV